MGRAQLRRRRRPARRSSSADCRTEVATGRPTSRSPRSPTRRPGRRRSHRVHPDGRERGDGRRGERRRPRPAARRARERRLRHRLPGPLRDPGPRDRERVVVRCSGRLKPGDSATVLVAGRARGARDVAQSGHRAQPADRHVDSPTTRRPSACRSGRARSRARAPAEDGRRTRVDAARSRGARHRPFAAAVLAGRPPRRDRGTLGVPPARRGGARAPAARRPDGRRRLRPRHPRASRTSSGSSRSAGTRRYREWARVSLAHAAPRAHGLGAARGARRDPRRPHAPRDRPGAAPGGAPPRRSTRLPGRDRDRRSRAGRRRPESSTSASGYAATTIRSTGRSRSGRTPARPASPTGPAAASSASTAPTRRADPGPDLARLRPPPERRHRPARAPDAARHARHDPLSGGQAAASEAFLSAR